MASNTQLRVISALVLVALLGLCVYVGSKASLFFIGLAGVLIVHEVYCNFLKLNKSSNSYIINIITFVALFVFVAFQPNNTGLLTVINNAGLVLNICLLCFLFLAKNDSKVLVWSLKKFRFAIGLIVAILVLNLGHIMFFKEWRLILWGLFILNFSVDTAAWFFGKNFGKTKLWEKVSPKKTVEGAIGGVLTSVILTSAYWNIFVSSINITVVTSFFLLACFAQVGDLIQSKMKRNFNIKDSSNLIPGHGGVYDRIDSLLFVAPFYVLFVRNLIGF